MGSELLSAGASQSQTKTVSLSSEEFVCPQTVNRDNWKGTETYPDAYKVTQDGAKITVKRTDKNEGWGMILEFTCCQRVMPGKLISFYFLHDTFSHILL